uniref:Small integral membrane protein 19 n=1 Tax=Neogobius melanostomus TaxID=47308 RepID=A0A8C6SHG2_9GOBI
FAVFHLVSRGQHSCQVTAHFSSEAEQTGSGCVYKSAKRTEQTRRLRRLKPFPSGCFGLFELIFTDGRSRGHGLLGNEPESLDYSVHEAWNEATNVYLLVILVSFGLLMYARKNKRKIMRIFTLPPTVGAGSEPNFYDSLQKVRLRQQLEMYSLGESRVYIYRIIWTISRTFFIVWLRYVSYM